MDSQQGSEHFLKQSSWLMNVLNHMVALISSIDDKLRREALAGISHAGGRYPVPNFPSQYLPRGEKRIEEGDGKKAEGPRSTVLDEIKRLVQSIDSKLPGTRGGKPPIPKTTPSTPTVPPVTPPKETVDPAASTDTEIPAPSPAPTKPPVPKAPKKKDYEAPSTPIPMPGTGDDELRKAGILPGGLSQGGMMLGLDPSSLPTGRQFFNKMGDTFYDALEKLDRNITNQRVGSLGANVAGGVGNLANMLGAPEVGIPAKFAEGLLHATDRLRDWSNQLHHMNTVFAEFSGPMAAVDIRQQAREIQLARERGSRRAESAEYLAERKFKAEESWAPVEDTFAKFQNFIVGWTDEQWSKIGNSVTWLGQKLNIIEENTSPKDNPQDWLTAFADNDFDKFGRPKRMPP